MKKKQGHLFIGGPLDGQWRMIPPNQLNVQSAHFPSWNHLPVNPNDPRILGTQIYSYDVERIRDGGGKVHEVYVCRHVGVNALEQLIARYPKKRKPEDSCTRARRRGSRAFTATMRRVANTAAHVFNTGGYRQEYEQLRTADAQRNSSDALLGADDSRTEAAEGNPQEHGDSN